MAEERTERDSEEESTSESHPRRGIFLIPNSITTIALFCGFYAIVASINGNFPYAAVAIWVGMFCDLLDGRVARMTNTDSEFGGQYDSLSDIVTFGVAPGLVVFVWGHSVLADIGLIPIGWIAAFVYVACAALRLARFNTSGTSLHFDGLPSPAAAGVVASAVWLAYEASETASVLAVILMVLLTLVMGILMVSNIQYYSPKGFNIKDRVPLLALLIVVLVIALIIAGRSWVLFAASLSYAASGPLVLLWHKVSARAGFDWHLVRNRIRKKDSDS